MRAVLALATLLAASGCVADVDETVPGPDPDDVQPGLLSYHLKPAHLLSQLPPASAAPQKAYAAPTANAYATEDLEVFASAPLEGGLHVRTATLYIHYAVDRPTGDPFRNGTDPTNTRHFVFWIGSDGTYPSFETQWGPPILQPGTTYTGELRFPLPAGGWFIPPGEPLQLLIAPLAIEAGLPNLHYLVDHAAADSRLVLEAVPWTPPPLAPAAQQEERIVVPGNSGAFTGAGPAELSTYERRVELLATDGLLQMDIRFESTKGGKSDLDFTLLDASGATVAASTTPYQSESIRLFAPNVAALGPGTYTIHVDAYSGLDTAFQVAITHHPLA